MTKFTMLTCRETERSCARCWTSDDSALGVLIEMPTEQGKTVLERLVEQLGSQIFRSELGPCELARLIDVALRAKACESHLPSWVMFAAVSATARCVEACVAGPHRVHLVNNKRIVASTREHVLACDDHPPGWSEDALSRFDRTIHGSVVTRALGKTSGAFPERTTWLIRPPYQLVVCPTDFHQYREPSHDLTRAYSEIAAGPTALLVLDAT